MTRKSGRGGGILARGGLALWLALAPLLAVAEGPVGFEPDKNDAALAKVLGPVFGAPVGGNGMDGGMGELFSALNAAVLLVAAVVTAYTFIAGTMATAHDGAVLGKRWSSMWVPIRVAVGTSMIIPTTGGYCGAQLLVFWLIGQSVGLGSMGWQSYSDKFLSPTDAISAPAPSNAPTLARSTLDSLVCIEKINAIRAQSGEGAMTGAAGITGEITSAGGSRYYGYLGADGSREACGRTDYPGVSTRGGGVNAGIAEKIGAAHANALFNLESDLRPLAKQIASQPEWPSNAAGDLVGATARYAQTVQDASNSSTATGSSYDQAMRSMNGQGFIYAGFRYIAVYTAGKSMAVASQGGPTSNGTISAGQDVAGALGKTDAALASSSKSWTQKAVDAAKTAGKAVYDAGEWAFDHSVTGMVYNNRETIGAVVKGTLDLKSAINQISMGMVKSVVAEFKGSGSNPYSAGIAMGHKIMGEVEATIMVLAVISLAAGPFAAGLWSSPAGLIFTGLCAAAYAAGVTLTLLPLVPTMAWIGFIIGWLLMCVEAVAAAPLWMVAHLNPESEGFTGKGSDGYLILVGVMLRPILGLIGLAASFSIGTVASNLLSEVFVPMFEATSGGNLIGFGSVVALISAFVMAQITILTKSFQGINAICDAVMRWVGGGSGHGGLSSAGDALGAGADRHHHEATQAMLAASRGMGGGSMARLGGAKGGDKGNNGQSERDGNGGGDDGKGDDKGGDGGPKGGETGPQGGRQSPSGDPQGGKGDGGVGGMSSNPSAGFAGSAQGGQETGGAPRGPDNSAEVAKLDSSIAAKNAGAGRLARMGGAESSGGSTPVQPAAAETKGGTATAGTEAPAASLQGAAETRADEPPAAAETHSEPAKEGGEQSA